MLAHLLADHEVLHGRIEVIAFEEAFAHAHVHVRRPAQRGRAVLGRETQASLVREQGFPETTLLDPDVSKGDGATDGVGKVAGRLQVRHGVGPGAVRCVEITLRPMRERQ